MKVAIIVDKKGTAIDKIAEMVKRYNSHLNIVICPLHPKRPSIDELSNLYYECEDADIIDVEYWKSGMRAFSQFPELLNKKKILSHHNPYDIHTEGLNEKFDVVLAKNKDIYDKLKGKVKDLRYIHIPVDLDFFKPSDYKGDSKIVLMVANRIESKKGILQVAQVCNKLGYRFVLVGSVSDKKYFDEVMSYGTEFFAKVSDEQLLDFYRDAAIHVCNSDDGFESGTMPILEAMASGCPVLTRNIGHVPDFYNGKNVKVRFGAKDDLDDLEASITELMNDTEKRKSLRKEAMDTVRAYSSRRMAYFYDKLYYEKYSQNKLVSVIIPTHNRKDILDKCLNSLSESSYPNIEVVVVDDNSSDGTGAYIDEKRKTYRFPLKYVMVDKPEGYNLGYARNLGAIESCGELLVFLDDRYAISQNSIQQFVANYTNHSFLYGVKDGVIKGFVENFSCIHRQDFIDSGMFACNFPYGFLSQETRARFHKLGFKMNRIDTANAVSIVGTHSRSRKRDEIIKSKDILYKMGYSKY